MSTKPSAKRVAVLDICGTLAPEDSWLALTRDLGASVDEHLRIFHDYRDGRISYPESKVQLVGLWRATGRANRAHMRHIFAGWPLDPAAAPLVQTLRDKGYLPVIITGAVDLYAQVVAERLDIANWFANTPLEFNAQDELTGYDYDLDQSGKKVRQLEAFCQSHNYQVSEAIAIGDGPNDLGLFTATGRGILLDVPDRPAELRAAAQHIVPNLGAVAALV